MLFEWSNPESWPSKIGNRPYIDEPVDEALVDFFLSQYKKVRVFHSCRTDNLASYLNRGIKLSCYSDIETYLVNLARAELNFEVPTEILRKVSASLGNYHEGSCFVVLDKDRLLDTAAHYSIYGSERLLALVNHLESEGVPISREILTRRGIPTVLYLTWVWMIYLKAIYRHS